MVFGRLLKSNNESKRYFGDFFASRETASVKNDFLGTKKKRVFYLLPKKEAC